MLAIMSTLIRECKVPITKLPDGHLEDFKTWTLRIAMVICTVLVELAIYRIKLRLLEYNEQKTVIGDPPASVAPDGLLAEVQTSHTGDQTDHPRMLNLPLYQLTHPASAHHTSRDPNWSSWGHSP